MEESSTERAVRALVDVAADLSEKVDPEVRRSIRTLAAAIVRSVDSSPIPTPFVLHPEDTLDEYGPGQLEALRDQVIGGQGPLRQRSHKFVVSFPDVELEASDIWPDGAPENPTPEDVIAVMKEQEYAHPTNVAVEWLLIESLYVRADEDEEGVGEVEWDGT